MDIHQEVNQLVESLWSDDDIPRKQLTDALNATYGDDHHVSHIQEEPVSRLFSAGTRRFRVEFKHPFEHGMCNHTCMVYVYRERSVAVEIITPYPLSEGEIIRLLTCD